MAAEGELQVPVLDPARRNDKPDASPPAIRRRLSAKIGEARSFYENAVKDGRIMSDDEFTRMETFTAERLGLERQLEVAERWHVVEGELEERSGQPGKPGQHMPHNDPNTTRRGRHTYSMMKAIRSAMDPVKYRPEGLELEVDQEMRKNHFLLTGHHPRGNVMIPNDLPVDLDASLRWAKRSRMGEKVISNMVAARAAMADQRSLDTAAGAGSIPTIVDTTMIELLRPRMVTANLGARLMTDMQGLFAIPRQTTAATFYMVSQGGSVTASNQTIDQVPFSPHTGGAYTTYTRQFLEQTNQDAEMFVREDQSAVVARGVETAALNGQGASGYPMGLLQNPQIAVYALGTNGAAPTWTMIITMPSYVSFFNADVGSLGWVCDALTRGTFQLILKVSGSTFPIYLWNTEAPQAPLGGYPCAVTNLLPQNVSKGSGSNLHTSIFGNWEDLIYAFWSGLDTIVDPYTSAASGAVNIVSLQDFDVNERHYQSFANCVDIISSITAPIT